MIEAAIRVELIAGRPGKSLPLQVMLDAASLAILYSKGKQAGRGDVYYTQVKNLKRIKGEKLGMVIPMQEKNIHVKLDRSRIENLRSDPLEGSS